MGFSPLHLAVINNHVDLCDVLIRAGIGKDGRTKVDRTPLHFAAYHGHFEILKILLYSGVEVDCKDMVRKIQICCHIIFLKLKKDLYFKYSMKILKY